MPRRALLHRFALFLVLAFAFMHAATAQDISDLRVTGPDGQLDVEVVALMLDNGVMNRDQTRYSQALALAREAIASDNAPSARTFVIATRLCLMRASFGDATAGSEGKRIVYRGLRLYPAEASLHELRVSLDLATNDHMSLTDHIGQMQLLLTAHPLTHRVQGRIALLRRNYAEAEKELRAALPAGPQHNPAWTYHLLADALVGLRRFDDAVDARRRAVDAAPEDASSLVNLANALLRYQGEYDEAVSFADRARCFTGCGEIPRALAEYGRWSDAYSTAPNSAATKALFDSAKKLIPDPVQAFQLACEFPGTSPIAIALLRSKAVPTAQIDRPSKHGGTTCLRQAATEGDHQFIRTLVGLGANVNSLDADGGTPLMWAAHAGDPESVKVLLSVGADATIAGANGTALSYAIRSETPSLEVLKVLLDASVDVNATDVHGRTVLFEGLGSPEVTKLLLDRGAEVNAADAQGYTPLTLATMIVGNPTSQIAVVKILLEHGADPNHKNANELSPIAIAEQQDRSDLVALMRNTKPKGR